MRMGFGEAYEIRRGQNKKNGDKNEEVRLTDVDGSNLLATEFLGEGMDPFQRRDGSLPRRDGSLPPKGWIPSTKEWIPSAKGWIPSTKGWIPSAKGSGLYGLVAGPHFRPGGGQVCPASKRTPLWGPERLPPLLAGDAWSAVWGVRQRRIPAGTPVARTRGSWRGAVAVSMR